MKISISITISIISVFIIRNRNRKDCNECFDLLETLPRAPRASSAHHLDIGSVGPEEIRGVYLSDTACLTHDIFKRVD